MTKNDPTMTKAEVDFANQAMKEALKRMEPELAAASDAAHKAIELADEDEDEAYSGHMMDLGMVTSLLGTLCAPNLLLLKDIMQMLIDLEGGTEEGKADQPVQHRH
jgi:hypothetical protein